MIFHKINLIFIHFSEYNKLKQCVANRLQKVEACNEHRIENVGKFIEAIFQVSRSFCSVYEDDTDKCSTMVTPRKKQSQRRTKSFFLPLIEIIAHL